MARVFNFCAGPAALPEAVLARARDELLDWHGRGLSVMEMSHRGKDMVGIAEKAEADLRELLGISDDYAVLFLQGGATAQFAAVPLNLLGTAGRADYVNTGQWSIKAIAEAQKYCDVNVAASSEATRFTSVPAQSVWQRSPAAAYLHYTPNETIGGVEYDWVPEVGATPLVADMSSTILSRPLDVNRFGVIYAGAQKNIGPAGLVLVIVRRDLLGRARPAHAGRARLDAAGQERLDVQHAADLFQLPRRAGVPVAEGPGRTRRHGRAQPAQGGDAVRLHRRQRLLREPGGEGLALVDERAVHGCRCRAREALRRRGGKGGPAVPRGSPLGRRHAREHLQRRSAWTR